VEPVEWTTDRHQLRTLRLEGLPDRAVGQLGVPVRRPVRSRTRCCILYENATVLIAKYGIIRGMRVNLIFRLTPFTLDDSIAAII
jgi:hypothetical protein